MSAVEIVSFGYLHGAPPPAHLTLDLRHHFRDPHVSPELRYMTAHDKAVRDAVLDTSGITNLAEATVYAVAAFAVGPSAGTVTVAVGCAGGRHRAPTVAMAVADLLTRAGYTAAVDHRDIGEPVIQR
ncbi:RapZ C-terminal domain-containing protein [Streptomyces niveus]|uniref:RapZ C-terminal domain-containing protein n=1 Tax=Streptomyces niveus TaxID=193462 RepID=UPI003431CC97